MSTSRIILLKILLIILCSLSSLEGITQIKYIDKKDDPFTPSNGEIMNLFEIDSIGVETKGIIMALHVQGNYLECILENHTDSTLILDSGCKELKFFIEFKEANLVEYTSNCDYDTFFELPSFSGIKTIFYKKTIWENIEIRIGIKIKDNAMYSNWVRYE